MSPQVTPEIRFSLSKLVGEMTRQNILDALQLQNSKSLSKYLKQAIEQGVLEMTLPDKPNSSNQRYRLTDLGQRCIAAHSNTNID
jgi:ATP-dependent DNA helicase RecG